MTRGPGVKWARCLPRRQEDSIQLIIFQLLANMLLVANAAFIVFAVIGRLLAFIYSPRAALIHVPAVAWAALVEMTGTVCPLTPLENLLRDRAGETALIRQFATIAG